MVIALIIPIALILLTPVPAHRNVMALAQFAAHAVGPIALMIANTLTAKVEHAPKCLKRPSPNSSPVFRSSRTRTAPPGL